jgi:hypothetical protein
MPRRRPQHAPDSLVIQTLLFDRDEFTRNEARDWAKAHGFRYGKVHTTATVHRLRQEDPALYRRGTFATFPLRPYVQAVAGKLR